MRPCMQLRDQRLLAAGREVVLLPLLQPHDSCTAEVQALLGFRYGWLKPAQPCHGKLCGSLMRPHAVASRVFARGLSQYAQ